MISKAKYGPWALITGGSEGVGAAFARQLGAAGINLILVARRAGPLEETAAAVRAENNVQVRILPLDLSGPDMLDRISAFAQDVEIGLVVCNAGSVYTKGPFVEAALDDVARSVQQNTLGQAMLCHHFGKMMAQRQRGGIVLIGSLAGNAGGATMVLYSANKAFSQSFAEGLWAELRPQGVDVAYVVLGATDTPERAKQGLQDSPDLIIDDPNDVARDTLADIANGPVLVRPQLAEAFTMFCTLPRRQTAEAMRDMLVGFQGG
jgi:short-subunit dehydrogenase